MKKIFLIMFAATLFAACGNNTKKESAQEPANAPATVEESVETAPEESVEYTSVELVDMYTQMYADVILEIRQVDTSEDLYAILDAFSSQESEFRSFYGDKIEAAFDDPQATDAVSRFVQVTIEYADLVQRKSAELADVTNAQYDMASFDER
ncbi:MAG: hypothetical protein E7088_07090 [Bacteroidales bacterium]|nr:hypothetical protein [Bacteroidales bacterium]